MVVVHPADRRHRCAAHTCVGPPDVLSGGEGRFHWSCNLRYPSGCRSCSSATRHGGGDRRCLLPALRRDRAEEGRGAEDGDTGNGNAVHLQQRPESVCEDAFSMMVHGRGREIAVIDFWWSATGSVPSFSYSHVVRHRDRRPCLHPETFDTCKVSRPVAGTPQFLDGTSRGGRSVRTLTVHVWRQRIRQPEGADGVQGAQGPKFHSARGSVARQCRTHLCH